MKLTYFLAEACQNTFVLFDWIEAPPDHFFWGHAHEALLKEGRDDALILTLERKTQKALYLKMHVLGVDGKFGEFCGNGARSAAAYLFTRYPESKEFYVVTKRGAYPLLSFGKGIYAIHLPKVQFSKSKVNTIPYGEILEPHLALKKSLSDRDLYNMGSHLNRNKALFPEGINVNAWNVLTPTMIAVKTYERGVQRLTKSCGTGSSVCASLHLKGEGRVFVKTPGGPLLIRIQKEHLELIGAAQFSHNPIVMEYPHE
jgi:diaminopimelate epimerase